MRQMIALLTAAALSGLVVTAVTSGTATGAATCEMLARKPHSHQLIISTTGKGSCSDVTKVKLRVCLQQADGTSTAWVDWGCAVKYPAPGTTATVLTPVQPCPLGQVHLVRTKATAKGFDASGRVTASITAFGPSMSGLYVGCSDMR